MARYDQRVGLTYTNSLTGWIRPELERKSKGVLMCYNCECEMPDNDMGNLKNITNKTFEEAAKASGKKPEEAKKNTLDLLEKNLSGKNKTSQTQQSS